MSQCFITADHHFGHINIINYCARPFRSTTEMDEAMVTLWNETVKPGDEVYHLGDIFWIGSSDWYWAEQLLKKLHGWKYLVKGSHDPSLAKFEEHGLLRVGDRFKFQGLAHWMVRSNVLLIHDYENRWSYKKEVTDAEYKIAFCGHVHRNWLHSNVSKAGGVALNVGVDLWSFRPVPWEVAVECQNNWLEYTGPTPVESEQDDYISRPK